MKLSKVLKDVKYRSFFGNENFEIEDITSNSEEVKKGSLFAAIKGLNDDGHKYIGSAVKKGAKAIVAEDDRYVSMMRDVAVIKVDNTREALSAIAKNFFSDPSSKLKLIGITGTNGKTTTSFILESILAEAGFKPGVIGTINYRYNGKDFKAPYTTPEPVTLERTLSGMVAASVTHCIMEVSSHALALKRVDGLSFDAAIFTNFSQDHLDFHKTMEDYFLCKKRFFTEVISPLKNGDQTFSIINLDDEKGFELYSESSNRVYSYGIGRKRDFSLKYARFKIEESSAVMGYPLGVFNIKTKLLGTFNLYNVLAASSVAIAMGIGPASVVKGVEKIVKVPGRFERVENDKNLSIFVDYAHTPDALENILNTVKPLTRENLYVLFGCGGDRDKSKRALMANAVAKYADYAFITSDNPRTEEPGSIINDILKGFKESGYKNYKVEPDRRQAISMAVNKLTEEDVLIVAGKGHEDYQIIGNEKFPFDDRVEVENALKGISW